MKFLKEYKIKRIIEKTKKSLNKKHTIRVDIILDKSLPNEGQRKYFKVCNRMYADLKNGILRYQLNDDLKGARYYDCNGIGTYYYPKKKEKQEYVPTVIKRTPLDIFMFQNLYFLFFSSQKFDKIILIKESNYFVLTEFEEKYYINRKTYDIEKIIYRQNINFWTYTDDEIRLPKGVENYKEIPK